MKFVNDPTAADLSPVGSSTPALVATRILCGEAFLWDPATGDAGALAEFLGEQVVAVGGKVYREAANGVLNPLRDTEARCVVVRPPAGDILFLPEDRFTTNWAIVHVEKQSDPEPPPILPAEAPAKKATKKAS